MLSAALRNWEERTRTTSEAPSRALRVLHRQVLQRRRKQGALRASPVQRLSSAMIGALLFINAKGEIILDRKYRDDYNKASVETFRNQASSARH